MTNGKIYAIHESTKETMRRIVAKLESELALHEEIPCGTMTYDEEMAARRLLDKAETYLDAALRGGVNGYTCHQMKLFRDKYGYLAA